jgi:hypothetical protein
MHQVGRSVVPLAYKRWKSPLDYAAIQTSSIGWHALAYRPILISEHQRCGGLQTKGTRLSQPPFVAGMSNQWSRPVRGANLPVGNCELRWLEPNSNGS